MIHKNGKVSIILILIFTGFSGTAAATECMDCHQYDLDAFPAINASLFGVHVNVNSTDGTGNLTSLDCMTCHLINTSVPHTIPVSTHTCEDCHINGTVPAAPRVHNHIINAEVSVAAQCGDCHNKTSNLFSFSANASAAHYGRNASFGLSPGEPYCAYCHENSSTVYRDVMKNQTNTMLGNHTSAIINPFHLAGRPDCTSCHRADIIHGINLTKPVPDYGFCNSCHENDPIQKTRHAGKVECIRCHTETPSDVHNIKYILPNGSYRSINATGCGSCHDLGLDFILRFSAANCTTCHQGSGLIKFAQAPLIPTPMNHSTNPYSGALWNSSQPAYWNNASQQSRCDYCHGNTLHASDALGNVANIQSGNILNQSITNTSYWCANCHYNGSLSSGNYSYNATAFSPLPPEIQNKTGLVPEKANDGTSFHNHSLTDWSDKTCSQCHGTLSQVTTALFVHNVASGGGGADCALCHDVNGGAPKRINFSAFKEGVHRNLNSFATSNTSLSDTVDKACWACHGDGTEPVSGHPSSYKTPKNCNNNDCHSLSQSPYKEPMVYSHFQNASLNGNPNNGTNYNITTSAQCQICHINSVMMTDNYPQEALVSHYAIKDNLIDSFNCAYCHRVKNNSEVWGNATLIYKNTTSLVELEKERNKLMAYEGESIYLGDGYSIKVVEISIERSEALIQLFKNNNMVDETSLQVGAPYNYEEYITIDNGTFRTPIIILNVTSIFKGSSQNLIQFSGFRTARVHAETNSTSCLACHLYRYSPEKERYLVIDRESRDIPDQDIIYYTGVLVDFVSENKSKIYYNDDDYVLSQINTDFGRFLTSPTSQKYLSEGKTWNLGENVSLKLNGVATDSKQALLSLSINDSVVENWVVMSGSEFSYTRPIRYKGYEDTNVTIFSATLASIAQANPNFVILKDVVAISPSIRQTTANTTIFGFNTSWLFPNNTFIVGKVPENFHQPNLYTDQRTWIDCVRCHDTSKHLNIPNVDAISSRLGRHDRLNLNASSVSILSDPIDKACWACHTLDGNAPNSHIPTYVTPRNCKSCHVYQEKQSFGAINISDEPHALQQNCPTCHIQNTHTLVRFGVSPVINKISLSKTQASRNETIHLMAEAIAGYKFKIRAAEYFLDGIGASGSGTPLEPVDGKFDSQMKTVISDINAGKISQGEHTLYIHAMERNNRWGDFSKVNFSITSGGADDSKALENARLLLNSIPFLNLIYLLLALAAAYFIVLGFIRR